MATRSIAPRANARCPRRQPSYRWRSQADRRSEVRQSDCRREHEKFPASRHDSPFENAYFKKTAVARNRLNPGCLRRRGEEGACGGSYSLSKSGIGSTKTGSADMCLVDEKEFELATMLVNGATSDDRRHEARGQLQTASARTHRESGGGASEQRMAGRSSSSP